MSAADDPVPVREAVIELAIAYEPGVVTYLANPEQERWRRYRTLPQAPSAPERAAFMAIERARADWRQLLATASEPLTAAVDSGGVSRLIPVAMWRAGRPGPQRFTPGQSALRMGYVEWRSVHGDVVVPRRLVDQMVRAAKAEAAAREPPLIEAAPAPIEAVAPPAAPPAPDPQPQQPAIAKKGGHLTPAMIEIIDAYRRDHPKAGYRPIRQHLANEHKKFPSREAIRAHLRDKKPSDASAP